MVKKHLIKNFYYRKKQLQFFQCKGCNTYVKGQRGISLHRKHCSFQTTSHLHFADINKQVIEFMDCNETKEILYIKFGVDSSDTFLYPKHNTKKKLSTNK
jgi:hypothetical protein